MRLLIEEFVFYLFLISIPFQTRYVFYSPGWAFNEWQSASLYLTDVLLGILFGFWILNRTETKKIFLKHDWLLIFFVFFSFLSAFRTFDRVIGLYQSIKLAEFVLFYFYISKYALFRFNIFSAAKAVIVGGVFQALVAIAQFLSQASIGLKYFGESVLSPNLPGVASFFINSGEKVIRAFGTTPHPNILAAYLLVCLVAWYFLYLQSYRQQGRHLHILYTFIVYGLILWGLFYTFSRVVIFAWLVIFTIGLIVIFMHYRGSINYRKFTHIALVTLVVGSLFLFLHWPETIARISIATEDEAVQLRLLYARESVKAGINWFGIGLGNFVPWLMEIDPNLPRYAYQPVHNIYLLIYNEVGIIGASFLVIFFAGLFLKSFHLEVKPLSRNGAPMLILGAILFIGLFDHFLWTLQQGRILLWFSTGLAAGYITWKKTE